MARRSSNGGPAALPVPLVSVDRDVEAMLRKSQPGYFSGEGEDVGKQLEEWIEKMDDYFDLAHSSEENKAMMGRFKLEKSAKLWWQDHCRENGVNPATTTWEYISAQLKRNYQSRTYRIERLNDFLDCSQGKDTLDVFYQRFLKLLKYAPPGMSQEAKVARFVSKLNAPMDTRLQSLRLTTFADVLDAGRPVEQEVGKSTSKETKATSKESQAKETNAKEGKKREADVPLSPITRAGSRLPPHIYDKARRERLCLGCLEAGHQYKDCPFLGHIPLPKPLPLPWQGGNPQRFNQGFNNGRSNFNNQANPNHIPIGGNRPFLRNQAAPANGPNARPNPHPQAQANARPNANINPRNQVQRARVNLMQAIPNEEEEEVARVHAAIEHQGPNQQYAVLQTPVEYEGIPFKLLIDSGATHSFISPACV